LIKADYGLYPDFERAQNHSANRSYSCRLIGSVVASLAPSLLPRISRLSNSPRPRPAPPRLPRRPPRFPEFRGIAHVKSGIIEKRLSLPCVRATPRYAPAEYRAYAFLETEARLGFCGCAAAVFGFSLAAAAWGNRAPLTPAPPGQPIGIAASIFGPAAAPRRPARCRQPVEKIDHG